MGYNFEVSLCRVSFCVQPFVSFLSLVFPLFVSVVSFSQKSNLLVWFCHSTFLWFIRIALVLKLQVVSAFTNKCKC